MIVLFMNPVTILFISISIVLVTFVILIPFIMSVLDPHNIPDNLANYYRSKKIKVTLIFSVIVLVVVAVIWLCSYKFGLLS